MLKQIFYYLSMPLFEISGNKISLISLILAVVVFTLSVKLSGIAKKIIRNVLSDKDVDHGVKGSLERITGYIVLVVGTLITLDTVGVNLNSLAAIGAVLMVGIGFGLQNITQNFISGLILLLERPIRVGDLVIVDGVSGKVVDIKARSTIVQTRDDVSIIIPNSKFIAEKVVNDSYTGDKRRYSVEIGVSYKSDLEKVKKLLTEIALKNDYVLNDPEPDVLLSNFGDSSIDFKLLIWTTDVWRYEKTLSEIRFSINKMFKENNVEIPFPQRDIHLIQE